MEVKMNRTMTVPEELANLLRQVADIFEEDEDFIQACFAICNRESDFYTTNSDYVDIIYKKGE